MRSRFMMDRQHWVRLRHRADSRLAGRLLHSLKILHWIGVCAEDDRYTIIAASRDPTICLATSKTKNGKLTDRRTLSLLRRVCERLQSVAFIASPSMDSTGAFSGSRLDNSYVHLSMHQSKQYKTRSSKVIGHPVLMMSNWVAMPTYGKPNEGLIS